MNILPSVDVPFVSGARSSIVAALQRLLQERGFYDDMPDGVVGPDTILAVKNAYAFLAGSAYQEVRDLVQGGPRNYAARTIGTTYTVLVNAFRQLDANQTLRGLARNGASAAPTYPDREISMTPAEFASMRRGF